MILRARDIRKRFEDRPVLSGVSLTIEPGEIVLLSGPNGSGKTTLARILSTLLAPDDGEVTLDDEPLSERRALARRMIGFTTHVPLLYRGLTPVENLLFFGRLAGVREPGLRAIDLLTRFGLADAMHRPLVHFSRGMLQRVVLSRALLHDPEILILDEPYAGLDEDGVATVNGVLREAHAGGRMVLVIAHGRERAQPVVTRTVRLQEGRIEAA
ncbi:MAG TPA: heme ABC exporter ATP-binding protein CcmA [Candidatus Eisenbacteria bacterium]|nr:heme ABC exporter ATP-binding protein CcmA [Candidatus Eisenbacteria bacterium]